MEQGMETTFPPDLPALQETDEPTPQADSTSITPGLQVRVNLFLRIFTQLRQLRGSTRRKLLFQSFVSLAQVVAFSVVAALASQAQCDEPFRTYLILVSIQIALSYLFSFYLALVPPLPNRSDTVEEIRRRERERIVGSQRSDRWVRRGGDWVDVFGFGLFVYLNVIFFESNSCKATSSMLYYTAMGSLILSYLLLFQYLLLILAILFFLPVVLIGVRLGFITLGEKKNEIGPLTKLQIDAVPLHIYQPASTPDNSTTIPPPLDAGTSSIVPTTISAHPIRRLWSFRRWGGKGKGSVESTGGFIHHPAHPPYLEISNHLATCSICLGDYEPPPLSTDEPDVIAAWIPEILRQLPCQHIFHKDCLDPWLLVSGRCPVCQSPVRSNNRRNIRTTSPRRAGGDDGQV